MASSYESFLKRIINADQQSKPAKIVLHSDAEGEKVFAGMNAGVLEEVRDLKDNMTISRIGNYTPAFQRVSVRNDKWPQQNL